MGEDRHGDEAGKGGSPQGLLRTYGPVFFHLLSIMRRDYARPMFRSARCGEEAARSQQRRKDEIMVMMITNRKSASKKTDDNRGGSTTPTKAVEGVGGVAGLAKKKDKRFIWRVER